MRLIDYRFISFFAFYPIKTVPYEPGIAFLIEYIQRLVAYLAEFGSPTGTSFNGLVFQYLSDDKYFLTIIDLIPDTLQNFTECRVIRVTPIH